MKKDDGVFLGHILESIELIEEYSEGLTQEKLEENTKIQDAIVRRIEIIGEAVKNLSEDITKKYFQIPWKDIAGMRDKITHHYFRIDMKTSLGVIEDNLPDLKAKLEKIAKDLKKSESDKSSKKK